MNPEQFQQLIEAVNSVQNQVMMTGFGITLLIGGLWLITHCSKK